MPGIDDRLTRELERAGHPAAPDPIRTFEDVARRRARRAMVRKVQVVAVVAGVLIATAGAFVAFDDRLGGGQPLSSDTPPPSPIPTTTPAPPAGQDIGLDFRVCHVERLDGIDLLGDGTSGTAWTGVPLHDYGQCPGSHDGPYLVAIDHTGDGRADAYVTDAFEYCEGCEPFATMDLDADGRQELVVLQQGGTEMQYGLYAADLQDGAVRFGPVLVDGDAPGLGLADGDPFTFWAGGDEGRSEYVECTVPSVIELTTFSTPIDGDTTTTFHGMFILADDGLLHVQYGELENAERGVRHTGPTCGGIDFHPAA